MEAGGVWKAPGPPPPPPRPSHPPPKTRAPPPPPPRTTRRPPSRPAPASDTALALDSTRNPLGVFKASRVGLGLAHRIRRPQAVSQRHHPDAARGQRAVRRCCRWHAYAGASWHTPMGRDFELDRPPLHG